MAKRTKLERKELYKSDYQLIEHLTQQLHRVKNNGTVTGLDYSDLNLLKKIHQKYFPGSGTSMSCNSCVYQWVLRVAKMLVKYEDGLKKDTTSTVKSDSDNKTKEDKVDE